MKATTWVPVLLSSVLGLLVPASPAWAMSAECESLISPRNSESAAQISARMAALQKCVDTEASQRAQAIPVLRSTGSCPTNLSYLDSRLPRYPGDAEYSKIRALALREDMVVALAKARNMGLTVAKAAEDALAQAEIAEAMERSMADLARAYNNTDEATLGRLKNGTYAYSGGTLPRAFEGYLAAYVGAVVNREAAAAIACIARHEQQSGSSSAAATPQTGQGQPAAASPPTRIAATGARDQAPLANQATRGPQGNPSVPNPTGAARPSEQLGAGSRASPGSNPSSTSPGSPSAPAAATGVRPTNGASGVAVDSALLGCWSVDKATRLFEDGTKEESAVQCSVEYFAGYYEAVCVNGANVRRSGHAYSITAPGSFSSRALMSGDAAQMKAISSSAEQSQRHSYRIDSGRLTAVAYPNVRATLPGRSVAIRGFATNATFVPNSHIEPSTWRCVPN